MYFLVAKYFIIVRIIIMYALGKVKLVIIQQQNKRRIIQYA